MINEEDATKTEALVQAQARTQRVAIAFAEVFGHEQSRSDSQRRVLEHLEVCAGDDANSYRFQEARDGVALIAAGIHRDGARSILRIIERQLVIASRVGETKKSKPKTTR